MQNRFMQGTPQQPAYLRRDTYHTDCTASVPKTEMQSVAMAATYYSQDMCVIVPRHGLTSVHYFRLLQQDLCL